MVKNLLKKVCLVVSVLLGLGSNVQAQETASVTFTEDGKTLTISGQGDLTTYSGDVTVTIFAEAANTKVSLNSWGGEITGQTYHPATQYYAFNSETNKWDVISDNESYFAEHPTYLENKVQKISFVQMLANQLKNNYETVRFVNDEPATPMYVDEEILQKFFYTVNEYNATNKYLKTLDLGAVTCKNFSSNFLFKATDRYPISTNLVLENLTLPLNETKIVPSLVISKLSSSQYSLKKVIVPEGYEKLDKQCFSEKSPWESSVYTPVLGKTFSLPSTLLEIGDDAFRGCDFSEITLPEKLKTIGKYAFTNTGLTSITFPEILIR